MKVVADAGPLIHLSWIDQLHLLDDLFETLLVPAAVQREVFSAEPGTPGLAEIHRAFDEGRWTILQPAVPPAELPSLGAGESEAIQVAMETQADLLLTDDALARLEARRLGIAVAGTIGILIQARNRGLLSAVLPLVGDLRARGQWISDELVQRIAEDDPGA